MLANFLAYERVPFDTDRISLVDSAKTFLATRASWERQSRSGIRVAWNQVTEDNNPKKGGASVGSPPAVSPPADSPPADSPPATEQCMLFMQQYRHCAPQGEEYFATLDVRAPDGLRIDEASVDHVTPANTKQNLSVKGGRLTRTLVAFGEFDKATDQAVTFKYGDLTWRSDNHHVQAPAYCEPSVWSTDKWNCNGLGRKEKRQFLAQDPLAVAVRLPHLNPFRPWDYSRR